MILLQRAQINWWIFIFISSKTWVCLFNERGNTLIKLLIFKRLSTSFLVVVDKESFCYLLCFQVLKYPTVSLEMLSKIKYSVAAWIFTINLKPALLFWLQFYFLANARMQDLCMRLDIVDISLKRKIWTCFEYSIVNNTELMQDRHLDQILMCAVYVMCRVLHTPVSNCQIG